MEYPLSGSAYTYILNIFGELPAWIAICCMLITYILGISANARVFTEYLALLFGKDINAFTKSFGSEKPPDYGPDRPCINSYLVSEVGFELDPIASALIIVLTILLCYGSRESSYIISTITILKLFLAFFIMIAAYTVADSKNITAPQCYVKAENQVFDSACGKYTDKLDSDSFQNNALLQNVFTYTEDKVLKNATGGQCYKEVTRQVFAPNHAVGVLSAASFAIFSLTGFESICNAAEEAQQLHHIPYAILGTTVGCTVLYFFISLSYVLMADWNCGAFLDNRSPENLDWNIGSYFGLAFCVNDLSWMRYIVALVALLGSITVIGISLYSASRVIMVVARDWVLPSVLATVSTKTQTPMIAQATVGIVSATIAFVTQSQVVYDLASFCTLVNLWMVVNALLMRRYYPETKKTYTRFGTVEVKTATTRRNRLGMELSVKHCRFWVWFHIIMINIVSIVAAICLDIIKDDTIGDCCKERKSIELLEQCCDEGIFDINLPVQRDCCNRKSEYEILLIVFSLEGAWALLTITMFLFCPVEYTPTTWHIANWLLPWLPSVCILLMCCTIAMMPWNESQSFRISVLAACAGILLFYFFYSLPMSYIKHSATDFANEEETNAIELVLVDGKWQHKNKYEDDLKNLRSQYPGDGGGTKKQSSFILSPTTSGSAGNGKKYYQTRGRGKSNGTISGKLRSGGGASASEGQFRGGKTANVYHIGSIDTIDEKEEDCEQQQQDAKEGGSR